MAWGLRLRNSAGAVVLDSSDRITRYLGSFSAGTANTGTFTDSRLAGGAAWILPIGPYRVPVVTFDSGSGTISWDWNGLPAIYRSSVSFRYGLY